ncbi:MAG: lysophospholipid acyltransferase family protein [Desulfobacterales bacterium]|nr:lysophospholipid acyltransferase family protein [Desulfobacterales bacterium]
MRRHILDNPISYYAIFLSVRYLPIRLCHWLGKLVALMVYAFSRKDRDVLTSNLSLALRTPPSDPFVRKTIRQIFKNYGHYMVDFFLMPQLPPHKIKRFFAEFRGEEILQKALANGKGVILLTAHLGNWEFGSIFLRFRNYPLNVVALAHNTYLTNALVNSLRRNQAVKVIEANRSSFSGIEILRCLRDNEIVAMIGDRDFFGSGRPIDFFGKKVSFPVGPVALAMKSGAALIPAFVLRQSDGRYFGVLEEAVPFLVEGDRDDVIEENLGKTARVFEKYIRSYPDQWYCPHPITGRMA